MVEVLSNGDFHKGYAIMKQPLVQYECSTTEERKCYFCNGKDIEPYILGYSLMETSTLTLKSCAPT